MATSDGAQTTRLAMPSTNAFVYSDNKSVLATALHQQLFLDVLIVCRNDSDDKSSVQVQAHRSVLAAASPVFMRMLQESENCSMVSLPHIRTKVMSTLLDLIYGGQVILADDDVEEFIAAAQALEIDLTPASLIKREPGGNNNMVKRRVTPRLDVVEVMALDDGRARCTICNTEFCSMANARRHVNEVHDKSGTEFECELCKAILKSQGRLMEHLKKKHNITKRMLKRPINEDEP